MIVIPSEARDLLFVLLRPPSTPRTTTINWLNDETAGTSAEKARVRQRAVAIFLKKSLALFVFFRLFPCWFGPFRSSIS